MVTRQRPVERGTERAQELITTLAREMRVARRGAGLSQRFVAERAGVSEAWLSGFEHGKASNPGLLAVARVLAVSGLDLSARAYPSAVGAARDVPSARLLTRFARTLHASLRWNVEVPLPRPGDQRAWDGVVAHSHGAWHYGVEAESRPTDGQALSRRLSLKKRDGQLDGVILVLPETRATRAFLREFGALLGEDFPIPGSVAVRRLRAGENPGGSAIVVV
jgi:transcriptional regulator with XRE-family HTH domain